MQSVLCSCLFLIVYQHNNNIIYSFDPQCAMLRLAPKYALHDTSSIRGASFWTTDSSHAQQINGAEWEIIQWKYQAISTILNKLSSTQWALLGMVLTLFQLPLILPATNGTSEQSFSTYVLLKDNNDPNYICFMVLHYHQHFCNKLDLEYVGNEYVPRNEHIFSFSANFFH